MQLLNKKVSHPMTYFVIDRPCSSLNDSDYYLKMLDWFNLLDINVRNVELYDESDRPITSQMVKPINNSVRNGQFKVIVLGDTALDYVNRIGLDEYFFLPSPSLKNDPDIQLRLDSCRDYVYNR